MTVGLSRTIAAHVVSARFDAIPAAAVHAAKRSVLDAVGVSLAASTLGEGCIAFANLARDEGRGACTVLGYGFSAPLRAAVLANGALAHALDFEDAYDGAPSHPNAAVVPVALALAQHLSGVSGKELITAIAIGCDLICRMGLALKVNPDDAGWYPPPILSAFGATATATRLLKLDERQTLDAFSLLLNQAVASAEFKTEPASTIRAVRDAFPAHAAVLSAQLAAGGVRGFDAPLEGKAGFYGLYAGGQYDPEVLLSGLGSRFLGADVSFKPWPSCRGTHYAVEAGLALRDRIDVAAITEIRLTGSPVQLMLVNPAAQKKAPVTAIDAKFSLPFTAASALIHGWPTLESFRPEALSDAAVRSLAAKVSFAVDPDFGFKEAAAGAMTLVAGGAEHHLRIDTPMGHPANPLSDATLTDKFLACAALAAAPVRGELLSTLILALDAAEDAGEVLTRALVPA